MWVGAFVGPVMIRGITDASATRKPVRPCTRSCGSTTASLSTPIVHVPTGCPKLAEPSVEGRPLGRLRAGEIGLGLRDLGLRLLELRLCQQERRLGLTLAATLALTASSRARGPWIATMQVSSVGL